MCWKLRIEVLVIAVIFSADSGELFAQLSEAKKEAGEKGVEQASLPEWKEIEPTVEAHFSGETEKVPAKRKRRKSQLSKVSEESGEGDLITQKDLSGLFSKLEKQGWSLDKGNRKEIEGRLLSDSDFLVRQLRSTQGKRFMRKMSSFPGGYDRLDRLRKMPYGRKRIQELIQGPDGDKLVEYMTTTKAGKNLGKQLSNTRTGRNFNDQTGRIYTRKDLLKQLQQSYQAEVELRKAKASGGSKKKKRVRKRSV